jgi:hypothetical protein
MTVAWQHGADVFGRFLRQRGVDPQSVRDVEAAWAAFEGFIQTPVDGILPGDDCDADGFIVQWGCWSWNDKRPALYFTRQFAVPDPDDPEGQPSYWQVELEMIFHDDASLEGLDELNESNTGFSFEPIGPSRGAELAAVHEHYLGLYPQLRALWHATPVVSKLSIHHAD